MNGEPIDIMIEYIGIMNIYTTLLKAEYLPFLIEISKFADVLQRENIRKTEGNIMCSAVRIMGGSLIIAGIALTPVSFGTSNGLTIAGSVLTGGSTIANISDSLFSKFIISKHKPKKTKSMFKNVGSSNRILSRIRQFAQRKARKTTGKFSDASFLHPSVSKVSQFAKDETQENQFEIIEDILKMWSRKLEILEENIADIYIKKVAFEIEEVTVDNSFKTRIKDTTKRYLNDVKMGAKRVCKTVSAVTDIDNMNKAGSDILNGASAAYDAYYVCSNAHECINIVRAGSLATIPNRAVEAKRLISIQPELQKLVPTSLKKSANGVITLHPALGCTIAGAGIISDGVSIGLSVRTLLNHETCTKAKTLHEVINAYESERTAFHKSMHQIADLIEMQLIPSIQVNENARYHDYQINEFNCLRKFLAAGFKSVFDICNQDASHTPEYEFLPSS